MRKRLIGISRGILSKEPNYVYYWLRFLIGFSFGLIAPVYAIFLFSRGLDAFQVGLVSSAFVLGNIIFNLPAGALADVWGRKKSFLVSTLFNSLCFLIYALGNNWLVFVIAEIISSLGFVFMTGILEAWVTDAWKEKYETEEFGFLYSRAETAGCLAGMIGGIVGGYLGGFNLRLPFFIGAIGNLLILPIAYFLIKENWSGQKIKIKKILASSAAMAKAGIKAGFSSKLILYPALFAFFSLWGFRVIDVFWSKRFVDLGGGKVVIAGILWPLMTLFMVLGNLIWKKWLEKKNYLTNFIFFSLLASLMIFLTSILRNFYLAAFLFLFYELSRGTIRPLLFGYLNKNIPTKKRATILAFNQAAAWLGAALSSLTLGWVAKRFSIEVAWLGASLMFLVAIIPISLLKKKKV